MIKIAARKLYIRYQQQIESYIQNPTEKGVNKMAHLAALMSINYLVGENGSLTKEKPSLMKRFFHGAQNLFNTANAELVNKYYNEAEMIYLGVIYGKMSVETESNESRIRFNDRRQWDLVNIFRNPRIYVPESGQCYTTHEIEENAKKGIDFGWCIGSEEEAKLRGFKLLSDVAPERQDAVRSTLPFVPYEQKQEIQCTNLAF